MSRLSVCSRAVRASTFFLTVFCSQILFASSSATLSLDEAMNKTLQHHPDLLQYKYQTLQADASKKEAGFRRGFSLELEMENFEGDEVYEGTQAAETSISVSSVIEFGFKRRARLDAATLKIDHLALEQELNTLEILSDLSSAFISSMSLQEKLTLAEENRELSRQVLETVTLRSKKGVSRKADLMRAKVSYAQSKMRYESTYQAYQRSRKLLASYWGERQLESESLAGEFSPNLSQLDFDQLYEKYLESPYSEILASKKRIANAEAKIIQIQNRPNIEWSIGVKEIKEVDESALVAGVSMPLFNSRRNKPSKIIVENELEILNLNNQKDSLELYLALFDAYSMQAQYSNAYQILSRDVIPNLETAMQDIKNGYERGRFTYSELVLAQNDLLAAKESKIESAERALLSEVILKTLTDNTKD